MKRQSGSERRAFFVMALHPSLKLSNNVTLSSGVLDGRPALRSQYRPLGKCADIDEQQEFTSLTASKTCGDRRNKIPGASRDAYHAARL